MARARNIKPGLFKNEILGVADPLYTLAFEGLWTLADKEGRLEDRPLRIKAEVFPYREKVQLDTILNWLHDNGFIRRYTVDGTRYILILAFKAHQNPHKNEVDSVIPPPESEPVPILSEPLGLIPSLLIPDSLSSDPPSLNNNNVASAPPVAAAKPPRKRNKNFEIAATMLPDDVAEAFTRCWEGWPKMGYNFKEKSNQPRRINQAKAAENFWLVCQNLNLATEDGTPIGPSMIADAALAWVDKVRQKTYKQYGNDIAPPVPCIANFFSADPASKKHWQEAIIEQFGAEP